MLTSLRSADSPATVAGPVARRIGGSPLGALCPPASSVRLPATANLAIVAALIQIPRIRTQFSFSGLPSCPRVIRLRWMRRVVRQAGKRELGPYARNLD